MTKSGTLDFSACVAHISASFRIIDRSGISLFPRFLSQLLNNGSGGVVCSMYIPPRPREERECVKCIHQC